MKKTRVWGLAAWAALIAVCPRASAQTNLTSWTFTPVDVPLPGVIKTYVRDMNAAGQIVGVYQQTGTGSRGFLLSGGNFTTISVRVPGGTEARGINPQGDIVGDTFAPGVPPRAFLLHEGVVTEFAYPDAAYTIAEDIDASGAIVGYYGLGAPTVNHGFLYRDGVFATVDVPGSQSTTARGINPEGEIVGVYQAVDPDGVSRSHGYLLRNDGIFTTINGPDVPSANLNGINPRGDMVGEYSIPGVTGRFGFLLQKGLFTSFSYPGATITRPFKITPDGQHIVGFYDDLHGFVLSRNPIN